MTSANFYQTILRNTPEDSHLPSRGWAARHIPPKNTGPSYFATARFLGNTTHRFTQARGCAWRFLHRRKWHAHGGVWSCRLHLEPCYLICTSKRLCDVGFRVLTAMSVNEDGGGTVNGTKVCVSPTSAACGQKENKCVYHANQRSYRHRSWNGELQNAAAGKQGQHTLPYLLALRTLLIPLPFFNGLLTDINAQIHPDYCTWRSLRWCTM